MISITHQNSTQQGAVNTAIDVNDTENHHAPMCNYTWKVDKHGDTAQQQ